MAYPSASAPPKLALPTTIISPQYCASSPLDLTFVRKLRSMSDGDFAVIDVNSNIIFKVKNSGLNNILVDAAGNPIATLRRKVQFNNSLSPPLSIQVVVRILTITFFGLTSIYKRVNMSLLL
jgi:hypothetical protein